MSNKVKRLNESERLEIISLLRQPNPASKRSIARQYEVSEAAIRKVWLNREDICKRSALMSEEAKKRQLMLEEKRNRVRNMHQLTIHDLFKL